MITQDMVVRTNIGSGREPRREFSRKTKRLAWERCGGQCEMIRGGVRCTAPIDLGRFIYDHIDPTWYSKNNELENAQVICLPCNADKTAADQGNIAKSKRIRDKRIKAKTAKRPFRVWRKMNGDIVHAERRR